MRQLYLVLLLVSSSAHARIDNPRIFQGEQSFGTTAGAPLSTDANNQVISGITNQEVSSSSATSCGTSDAQVTGMTVTPVAGTYLVLYSSDFNSAASGMVVTLSYFLAAAQVAISQRKFMPFAGGTLTAGNQRIMVSLNSIIAVNGSQAISVHCSTSASTSTSANSQLDIVRLL